MRRVVSVWLPTLPTDRIKLPDSMNGIKGGVASFAGPGQRPGLPLVTIKQQGNTLLLAAVNATAASQGLQAGMPLAHAQALVSGLQVETADPVADAAALLRLAAWCLRYAPLAAPDPPNGLWIDVTGSAHLHGGEKNLLRDLVQHLARQGLTARAAVADTPAIAHAVARFGGEPTKVVPPGGPVMADLPIKALRLPAKTLAGLRQLGFERIGALATAARAPLVRRFGRVLALRLDQAAGKVFEPIMPIVPPALIQHRLGFVEPLMTAEAFTAVIARLVPEVCTALEQAGQGARRLDLLFECVDGSVQAIRVGTASPVRDARHLQRMLTERLERVDPGLGVEAMRLVVGIADPLGFVQTATSLTSLIGSAVSDLAPLVDLLVSRLGEARVYRIAPVASYVPERSVRQAAALTTVNGGWPEDLPRPVRLLNPPQPVEAMALLPHNPPIAFTWRRVRHRVRYAEGPERIAGEWWKHERETQALRDYFRIEDEDGRRFWLFRYSNGSDPQTGDMSWFLHGFF